MEISKLLIFVFCSLISLYLVEKLSVKFNFYDLPNKKKIHKEKTTKAAGLALIPTIFLNLIFFDQSYQLSYFMIFLIVIIFFGFADDLLNFTALTKLLLLFIILSFFVVEVITIKSLGYLFNKNLDLHIFSIPFTILCFLFLINSFNYFDGLDGLLGSLSLISMIYFIYFSHGQLSFFLMSIIIYLIIFLFFNFGVLPKQFMGDSGSLGLGFIVSFLATYLTQHESSLKPSFVIWPLAFFVYEFLSINLIRIRIKKNIFSRDLNFIFNIFAENHGQNISVLICIIIHLFFCFNGIILENFKMGELSIFLFCIYFILYLKLRLAQFDKFWKNK
tara:strand:- start:2735 stop:3730 length:996 start_codon:yes stop_codon:yes gene_type:complete